METSSPSPNPNITAKLKKSALSKVLPSDRLTFDRQIEALKAYAAEYEANGGKPVTNEKAGQIGKMAAATIVVTNAFFCDIGLLSRNEDGFTPSMEAVSYLNALAGLSPETAAEKLKPIFEKQWFSQITTPRLRMRSMEQSEVIKILGEEASAGKEQIPRLEILIEFMNFVGVIRKEGNQIFLPAGGIAPVVPPEVLEHRAKCTPAIPDGQSVLPIPLNARTGRNATLQFPTDLNEQEVGKLLDFIKLSFDYAGQKED